MRTRTFTFNSPLANDRLPYVVYINQDSHLRYNEQGKLVGMLQKNGLSDAEVSVVAGFLGLDTQLPIQSIVGEIIKVEEA